MSKISCLCKTCPSYSLLERKVSSKRRSSITSMLREHRQEKKNLIIYAQNIKLFLQKIKLLTTKKAKSSEQTSMFLLVQQHLFCKVKIKMVSNTLGLLTTTERAIVTGLYLDNTPIQQVSSEVGYEIAQVYRFAGLAVSKIASALPMW